ncbi:MAG: hypothetical protein R6X06_06020 [Gammaproteobacteria bacterium]
MSVQNEVQHMRHTLVFAYNADSGLFNTVSDIAHKILSPQTYSCQLCALTHGYFAVREEWLGFLATLNVDCEFLHRDELQAKYALTPQDFPAIYLKNAEGRLDVLADREAIEACDRLESLEHMLQEKLQHLNRASQQGKRD